MTLSKLTTGALATGMLACLVWLGVMLVSPVMGASTYGEASTCGSLGGLILRGGETRNNGGDISGEQFDQRIDDCRTATLSSTPLLALPIGLGTAAWWGAMTVSARSRTEAAA